MVNYVCIGKGTTDENGVAHITHDCQGNQLPEVGYKGHGAGDTLIVASLDKPVGVDSLLSNVLEVNDMDNYLLTLTADKSIIQSGDTCNLSATLTNNNIPVSGKSICFSSETVLKKLVSSGQTTGYLSDDFHVTVTGSGGTAYVALGRNNGNFLSIYKDKIVLYVPTAVQINYKEGTSVNIKNNVLTYIDTNNEEQTVDVSDIEYLKIVNLLSAANATFLWYSVYATTDSEGVASFAYDGVGVGELDILAEFGSVVSEPYGIYDTIFKDIGNTDNSSNWSLSVVTYTQTDDYVTLDNSSGASRWIYPKVNGSQSILDTNTDYCWEIDLKNVDATHLRFALDGTAIDNIQSLITTTGFTTVKIWSAKSESKVYYEVNGTTRNVTTSTPSGEIYIRLLNGETIQFKNMKVYPI